MPKAPETMDELFNFSKEFTKDGKYGFLALEITSTLLMHSWQVWVVMCLVKRWKAKCK